MRNSIDRESLRTLVADAIDIDVSELTDTADFRDDLEVDSLMSLEMMVVLEQEFGVKIGQDEMKPVRTFDDLIDVLDRALEAKSASD